MTALLPTITIDFMAFTSSSLPKRIPLHSATHSPSYSIVGAIRINKFACNSEGRSLLLSLKTASMSMTTENSSGINTDL